MKKNFLLIVILLLIASCSDNTKKQNFTLKGEIINQDSGKVVLRYFKESSFILDTSGLKNGKFSFKGTVDEPTRATLYNNDKTVDFYLEPGLLKITLDNDNFEKIIEITGSKTQADEDTCSKMTEPVYNQLDLWREKGSAIRDSLKNTSDDLRRSKFESELKNIDHAWFKARADLDKTWLKFVLAYPDSYSSVYYLNILGGNDVLTLDSLILVFNKLNSSVQNSVFGKNIQQDIRKKGNIKIGAIAPEFKTTDLNNKTISLSEFHGRSIVLLDFWASWCVPCREAIPHLKTLYSKYHAKGLEVISVSQDMNRNAWVEAVKQEGIDIWYNIPVAEKYALGPKFITNDDIYFNYAIGSIPAQLLIDKDSRIIGRWKGYSIENESSLDTKLAEIFTKY
ncbi:MAG: TlpA disulfide reductase family protein [Bacteroidia bacterium]|nr:TlpA disulfide reductase family protein [Bacteroidia bacterium]